MEGRGYLQETEQKQSTAIASLNQTRRKELQFTRSLLDEVGVRISKEHYDRCATLCLAMQRFNLQRPRNFAEKFIAEEI